MVQNLADHAFSYGLMKSKNYSEVSQRYEREVYMSQFGRRSFFKELADPDKLDEVKNQFSYESSDDSPEAVRVNFKKSKLKRVTKIIDVSEGI